MQQQTIYIPAPHSEQKGSSVKPTVKPKRKAIHVTESVKNKLLGASVIALGIFTAVYTGDGTAMILTLFIGIGAIFD